MTNHEKPVISALVIVSELTSGDALCMHILAGLLIIGELALISGGRPQRC